MRMIYTNHFHTSSTCIKIPYFFSKYISMASHTSFATSSVLPDSCIFHIAKYLHITKGQYGHFNKSRIQANQEKNG